MISSPSAARSRNRRRKDGPPARRNVKTNMAHSSLPARTLPEKPAQPTVRRGDPVDVLLVMWVLILGFSSPEPGWLPVHALVFQYIVLFVRRVVAPQTRREAQLLGAASLSLATGATIALSSAQDPLLKAIATNLFFFGAWFFVNELMRRPLGGNLIRYFQDRNSEPTGDKMFRQLLERPGAAALAVFACAVAAQTFWPLLVAPLVPPFWMIPFALNVVYLRRISPVAAAQRLQDHPSWPNPFGGAKTILLVLVLVVLFGFANEFFFPEHPAAWFFIAVLLVLQGWAIVQINHWASQAKQTLSG